MFNRNTEIKEFKQGIPYWIIAEQLGIHENTLRNWMRKEMNEKKKAKVMAAITEIKEVLDGEREL